MEEDFARLNILVVDDDPVFRFINTKVLQHAGFTKVETAVNGRDALKKINNESPDKAPLPFAIFVDLNMPELDGFGFIEALKNLQIHENIHLVILTSSVNPSDKMRASDLGVKHYLTKPVTENDMKGVLENFIASTKALDQS